MTTPTKEERSNALRADFYRETELVWKKYEWAKAELDRVEAEYDRWQAEFLRVTSLAYKKYQSNLKTIEEEA